MIMNVMSVAEPSKAVRSNTPKSMPPRLAAQEALYVSDERGCRIRRETQSLFYMCCDGVRCRLNEGKKEIVVEMPCDLDSVGAYVAKAKVIEDIIKSSQKKRAS